MRAYRPEPLANPWLAEYREPYRHFADGDLVRVRRLGGRQPWTFRGWRIEEYRGARVPVATITRRGDGWHAVTLDRLTKVRRQEAHR